MKKYILIISLLLNVVFFGLIIRHFVNLPKPIINNTITYWLHRDEVFTKLPVDSGAIIFAGDSHTQQFEVAELFHTVKVKNRGINFDTAEGLLNRIDAIIKSKPSKIFIEIGVNDLVKGETVEHLKTEISELIIKIKRFSPQTKIYLESVIPTRLCMQRIKKINELLPSVADSLKVTFINLDPCFLGDGLKKQYDSGDGLHLNGSGYLKWREVLLKYVNE